MKNIKLIYILIFVLILFLTIGVIWSNPKTIKVGLICDLTGRSSGIGISSRNAIEIAIDNYNEVSKKNKIKLIVKDDKGLPQTVPQIIEDYHNEGVKLIIGPLISNIAFEILSNENIDKESFLFISPTITAKCLSKLDDNIITLISVNENQGLLLANEAINKGIEKAAIAFEYDNNCYSEPIAKTFEEILIREGKEITYLNHFKRLEKPSFKQLAKEIIASEAEAVLIVAGPIDSSQLVQHLYKSNPNIEVFTGIWAKTNDFITNGGKAVEGAYLAGINNDFKDVEEFNEFNKEYIKRYSLEPSFSAICSYEAINILFDTIKENKTADPQKIKEIIINKKTFNGLAENYNIDSYGDSDRPYVLFQVQNGEFKMVTK